MENSFNQEIKLSKIVVGELQCNCYLIEKNKESLLIDPGAEYNKIKEFIKGKNVKAILITHNHFDHIGAVKELVKEQKIPVYDINNLNIGINKISNFQFEVIKTPGHAMDSITYYFKNNKLMFTGDFLFYNTIGRCDFVESSIPDMLESIKKIKNYDDDITIYPGHGPSTNLGREKKNNIYFIKEFI